MSVFYLDTSAIVKRSFIDLEQECADVYPSVP